MHISPNDPKAYQYLELNNGLKALLVSDPQTTRSAAALAVNIGHFDDPKTREGMAHFLEHMLFLGTDDFPKAGEYQAFITRHGGHNNAWTSTEFTNYFFDIKNQFFESALERFASFFTCPRFDSDLVEREREAVDAEFRLKIRDDVRRAYQVHKETVNQAHPFSKFSVGNHTTLADRPNSRIRDELIAFYQQHYSAKRMTLTLVAPFSLEELTHICQRLFARIVSTDVEKPALAPLYLPEHRAQRICIEPIKDIRKLTLSFDFDDITPFYQCKPLTYLAHLIGYEGSGSLISLLRQQGHIHTMAAGGGVSGSNFKEFSISFNLTEKGLSNTDYIIESCFAYIRLIEAQGIEKWRYQEKASLLERAFRFQEKVKAIDLASHLAINLANYPKDDVLYGDYVMSNFDAPLINSFISQMVPRNMRLSLMAKDLHFDKHDAWYQCPYAVSPIEPHLLTRWAQPQLPEGIHLPEVNPFLSFDEPVHHKGETINAKPSLIHDDNGFRLWFCNEPQFKVPKGHIYLSLDSAYVVSSVRNMACTRLLIELMLDYLSDITYQAEIAGMGYQIYSHQGGFTLHLSGFSDKQIDLLHMILANRRFGHYDKDRFDIIKEQLLRHWRNQQKAKPINQLFNYLTALLQPNAPSALELADALENVEHLELPTFIDQLYQHVHIETFIYGNWPHTQAEALSDYIRQEATPYTSPSKETPRQLVSIKGQGSVLYAVDCQQNESALIVYYQGSSFSARQIALFTLSNHLMSSQFFHELRTKKQWGYIVGTGNLPLNRHPGIIFYVQSPHGSPQDLLDAINAFLNAFPLTTFELSEAQWQESKQGLISQLLEPENNMRSRAQRFWSSIGNKDFEFNQRELVAECVAKLTRADVVRFVMRLKRKNRDRVVIYHDGQENSDGAPLKLHPLERTQSVSNRFDFQKQTGRYIYR